jgi:hypothetical protein
VKTFEDRFAVTFQGSFDEARTKMDEPLTQMGARVLDAMKKYPDYAVDVSVGPDDLKNSPAASYIKVKAVVKNYRWSKVDVDSKEMRNLRSLVPE